MVENNDSLPGVTPVYREIQVRSKKDLSKDNHDRNKDKQKHKSKSKKNQINPKLTFFHETDDIDLANLLIKRKNLEVTFYDLVMQKEIVKGDALQQLENEIGAIRYKILEVDSEIENYDIDTKPQANEDKIGLKFLNELLFLYKRYAKLASNESETIASEKFENLAEIMPLKNTTLDKIESTQKKINYQHLNELEPSDEKRIKAEKILSDIKAVINEIIEKEEQNSVELQSRKKGLQYELNKMNSNLKVIKGYSRVSKKPRFIDTSK